MIHASKKKYIIKKVVHKNIGSKTTIKKYNGSSKVQSNSLTIKVACTSTHYSISATQPQVFIL